MGDTHDDPTDHSRTTQPRASIAMKDNFFWPGFILPVVSMFGVIDAAQAAAYRHYEWLSTTVLVAVLGAVAGALWLVMEHRRVTRIEAQWDAAHLGSRPRALANHNSEHPADGDVRGRPNRNVCPVVIIWAPTTFAFPLSRYFLPVRHPALFKQFSSL